MRGGPFVVGGDVWDRNLFAIFDSRQQYPAGQVGGPYSSRDAARIDCDQRNKVWVSENRASGGGEQSDG